MQRRCDTNGIGNSYSVSSAFNGITNEAFQNVRLCSCCILAANTDKFKVFFCFGYEQMQLFLNPLIWFIHQLQVEFRQGEADVDALCFASDRCIDIFPFCPSPGGEAERKLHPCNFCNNGLFFTADCRIAYFKFIDPAFSQFSGDCFLFFGGECYSGSLFAIT